MRALGVVLVLFTFLVVCYPIFLTFTDINGSLSATAEQLLGVLAQVVLIVISGQPAQPPLFVAPTSTILSSEPDIVTRRCPGFSTAIERSINTTRVRVSKD